MSGQGYKNRKKLIHDVKMMLGRSIRKRRMWPHLEEGQYVYMVKNRTTGELKEVVAIGRLEAESIAFGFHKSLLDHDIRSMPIHSWKESKGGKTE